MSPFWILLEIWMMEVAVTIGAVRRAKLQSNRCQQQTNIHIFFTGRMPFLSCNQQCQSKSEGTTRCRSTEIDLKMYLYYCILNLEVEFYLAYTSIDSVGHGTGMESQHKQNDAPFPSGVYNGCRKGEAHLAQYVLLGDVSKGIQPVKLCSKNPC